MSCLMVRQSLATASCDHHEDTVFVLTLSLSKGEERRAKRESTNAASTSERPDEAGK